jgi:hypothetical protein
MSESLGHSRIQSIKDCLRKIVGVSSVGEKGAFDTIEFLQLFFNGEQIMMKYILAVGACYVDTILT